MEHRQLGRGGPLVSVLGLGASPIGGGRGVVDESLAISTIRATAVGVTFAGDELAAIDRILEDAPQG